MASKRRRFSPEFKFKVINEIIKGEQTASQLASKFGVQPAVLSEWKQHYLQMGHQIFEKARKTSKLKQEEKKKAELFEQIGRLKMENEWLKKKLGP